MIQLGVGLHFLLQVLIIQEAEHNFEHDHKIFLCLAPPTQAYSE